MHVQVLGLFIEVKKSFPEIVLQEAKTILEAAVKLQNTVEEGSIPLWKDAYYSLVMIEKMLKHDADLCFQEYFKVIFFRNCYLVDHLMFNLIFLPIL